MGESSCVLTILDVADVLQAKFAFLSGGKSRRNFHLITFPECQAAGTISDEQYRNAVTYLASIPPLQEAELGFVLIIDRRQDKWGSVKTLLLRISGYFPALVQKVYLLRPSSFLQKTFADMGLRFLKEDFKFKILMLNSVEELHDHVDRDQLTEDLGGTLQYNHHEWMEHRAALEKFSANTSCISETLRKFCRRLQETEFPNDVTQTEFLIQDHEVARQEVKEDLESTIKHGEVLLTCFKTMKTDDNSEVEVPTTQLPNYRLTHVSAVDRLMVQLDETVNNFQTFWEHHKQMLEQCLQLRKFEEDFKHLQFLGEKHLIELEAMTDVGESLANVEAQLQQLNDFESRSKVDVSRAEQLRTCGENFIEENHYAVDCIRPKCAELERICGQYKSSLARRSKILNATRELLDKIDKANKWCTKGVDLLASQAVDKCSTEAGVQSALEEIDRFIETAEQLKLDHPKEFRNDYDIVLNHDIMTMVQQVLQKLEDVRSMCNKRRDSLQSLIQKPAAKPVQAFLAEPDVDSVHSSSSNSEGVNDNTEVKEETKKKFRPSLRKKVKLEKQLSKSSFFLNSTNVENGETIQQKRRHVMQELIETEKVYVDELRSILQGYAWQMDRPEFQEKIPEKLKGKKEILFGNLDQIYNFHARVFLKELEECRETPTLVGQRFVERKEEFKMYSKYCQNKMASEDLRKRIGDDNAFFKECQRKLDHKLPLEAYLLRPVQRITQYQLLLGKMLTFAQYDVGSTELQEALDTMISVVKHVNDVMHQISIKGFSGSLEEQGRLLMQGSFNVWTEHKKDKIRDLLHKPSCRHIFLYEKSVLFCKKKDDAQNLDKASYVFKTSLLTSQLGLTENIKGDKKKFELWLRDRVEVYIIQATSVEVKNVWVTEIKKVLLDQFDLIRALLMKNGLSNSEKTGAIDVEDGNHISLNNNNGFDKSLVNRVRRLSVNQSTHVSAGLPAWEIGRSPTVDAYISMVQEPKSPTFDSGIDVEKTRNPQESTESQRYVVIGDYIATESAELTVNNGDMVELILVGSSGWWLVRAIGSGQEGWMPARYLENNKCRSTCSLQSISPSSESQGTSPEEDMTKSVMV